MSLFNLDEHSGLADANFGGKAGKAADDGWKSHTRHARIQRLLEEPNATVAEFAAHIRAGNTEEVMMKVYFVLLVCARRQLVLDNLLYSRW